MTRWHLLDFWICTGPKQTKRMIALKHEDLVNHSPLSCFLWCSWEANGLEDESWSVVVLDDFLSQWFPARNSPETEIAPRCFCGSLDGVGSCRLKIIRKFWLKDSDNGNRWPKLTLCFNWWMVEKEHDLLKPSGSWFGKAGYEYVLWPGFHMLDLAHFSADDEIFRQHTALINEVIKKQLWQ